MFLEGQEFWWSFLGRDRVQPLVLKPLGVTTPNDKIWNFFTYSPIREDEKYVCENRIQLSSILFKIDLQKCQLWHDLEKNPQGQGQKFQVHPCFLIKDYKSTKFQLKIPIKRWSIIRIIIIIIIRNGARSIAFTIWWWMLTR